MPTGRFLSFQKNPLRRFALLGAVLALALPLGFAGCSDDSSTGTPSGPADFSGTWTLEGEVTAKRVCDNPVGTTRTWIAVITQEGSSASMSLNDGPPIALTINGSQATGTDQEDGGVITFALQLSGNTLSGTLDAVNDTRPCTEAWDLTGTRAEEPSGNFAGFWNLDGEFVSNGCELGFTPDCLEFVQDGSTVTVPSEGLEGTANGNQLTMQQVLQIGTATLTFDVDLEMSTDGNTMTGTNTVTSVDSQNPQFNCSSVLDVVFTRTSSCDQQSVDQAVLGIGVARGDFVR